MVGAQPLKACVDLIDTAAGRACRASSLGCGDALTYLGEPAVLSVGTLFQAAVIPGVMLAFLYAAYAFGFALIKPEKAPPIPSTEGSTHGRGIGHSVTWFGIVPVAVICLAILSNAIGVSGSQNVTVSSVADIGMQAELRTNVSEQCMGAMIDLHGQEKWDRAVAQQAEIDKAGGNLSQEERTLSPEQLEAAKASAIANAAPIGTGLLVGVVLLGLVLSTGFGVSPDEETMPALLGVLSIVAILLIDFLYISPVTSPGIALMKIIIPLGILLWSVTHSAKRLSQNELLRVVFPPLILIVAVLGSILGGITNPTPAAALGAAGAIMLAAFRKLQDEGGTGKPVLVATFSMVIMLLLGVNFDLRVSVADVSAESWIAYIAAMIAYHIAIGGVLFACWILFRTKVLSPVVRETAKVTSMVFAILIGSQLLNLVIISFGGEHYIQEFLRSIDNETKVFLIVMGVLFFLGFVLDFLEIIYIVVPIVGPVIYGGTLDPKWVTIMIAVNLQTSFLTPPFGFALFYLRGVAPPEVTTGHIYRGVIPFVLIQVAGLGLLWLVPSIVTILPDLMR